MGGNKEHNDKETQLLDDVDKDKLEEVALENILKNVPPEYKEIIERSVISSFVQMRNISSPETEVMKQLTSEHISKYLDGAELEMKNSYDEKFQRKVFTFSTMIVAMIFVIILVILLKDMPDIMEKVMYVVGSVVIGAFGGYGFGKNRNDE